MLSAWLANAAIAVVPPALISLWSFRRYGPRIPDYFWIWCVVAIFGSMLLSFFDEKAGQLHFSSAFFLSLAILNYLGFTMPPILAYGLTFLVSLSSDIFLALAYVRDVPPFEVLLGIGGAGAGDSLFIVPLAAAALQWYVRVRTGLSTISLIDPEREES